MSVKQLAYLCDVELAGARARLKTLRKEGAAVEITESGARTWDLTERAAANGNMKRMKGMNNG